MKKIIKAFIYFVFIFFLSGCGTDSTSNTEVLETTTVSTSVDKYDSYIRSFSKITTDDILTLEEKNESYFIYTGRVTCPYCRIFVPKLYTAALLSKHNDVTINYLNSEDELDLGLDAFREKHLVEFVPNLSYFEGADLIASLDISEDTTVEEIDNFISIMKPSS